jgi:hypothetical protein
MRSLLDQLARAGAFRPALRLDELAAVHIPFGEFGLEGEPERMIAEGIAQHTGVTLVVGEGGNGKSSALAYVADRLASAPANDGRRYLPLFVPVASRGEEAADLRTFGAMAIGNVLASFDDLSDEQEAAFRDVTAEAISREAPSRTFNAGIAAKVFGAGVEGGVESKGEVITVTTRGAPPDEYGGITTLAHTLRGRARELVVIVEDTDGWTLRDGDDGRKLARRFFGGVLAPLALADVSVVVAVQTHWTTDVPEFAALNERAVKRVTLPTFDDPARAEATVRRVLGGRIEWTLGGPRNAADALTDAAVSTLAETLGRTGSIRKVLTLVRDTLDQLGPDYPERLGVEHLVESA